MTNRSVRKVKNQIRLGISSAQSDLNLHFTPTGELWTQTFLMRTSKNDQTVLMLCDAHWVFSCQGSGVLMSGAD